MTPPDHESMNNHRASWALTALEAFQEVTSADNEDALADLLCNLMHLADRKGPTFGTFEAQLKRARDNYQAETAVAL